MTNEEAIVVLQKIKPIPHRGDGKSVTHTLEIIAIDKAIKALEQQPCDDCISRQAAINALGECPMVWTDSDAEITAERDWKDAVKMLKRLPPITPQQKIGHWILLDECSNSGYYCSECHKKVIKEGWSNTVKKVKYCPNCGAKMESEYKE